MADRTVLTPSGEMEVAVWRRAGLEPGQELVGPCVVVDDESTIWLEGGDTGIMHETGALEVTW